MSGVAGNKPKSKPTPFTKIYRHRELEICYWYVNERQFHFTLTPWGTTTLSCCSLVVDQHLSRTWCIGNIAHASSYDVCASVHDPAWLKSDTTLLVVWTIDLLNGVQQVRYGHDKAQLRSLRRKPLFDFCLYVKSFKWISSMRKESSQQGNSDVDRRWVCWLGCWSTFERIFNVLLMYYKCGQLCSDVRHFYSKTFSFIAIPIVRVCIHFQIFWEWSLICDDVFPLLLVTSLCGAVLHRSNIRPISLAPGRYHQTSTGMTSDWR